MLEIYLVCGVLYKLYFCQKCGEQAGSRVWSLETHWDANIQICTDSPSLIADTQSHSQSTYSYHTPAYIEDFCKRTFVSFWICLARQSIQAATNPDTFHFKTWKTASSKEPNFENEREGFKLQSIKIKAFCCFQLRLSKPQLLFNSKQCYRIDWDVHII